MNYEMVLGLEVHVELATKTKIFCSCTTEFGGEPNTHCCEVCTGQPGALPVLNRKVVEYSVRAGLATGCSITQRCKFDRKNYFYPDLPKAYQISQLYLPICHDGGIEVETEDGGKKIIGIKEIHMEEDAGKLVHDPWEECSLVDYNRCGVSLIEIVSQPDFRSAHEVISYLERLKAILQFVGVSDCKMQEGSLRADVNLSVRPIGQKEFGTRTEMKNINSFKAIARAIAGESQRQIELLEAGKRVIQETRRWDDNKGASYAMRSKENAQDYKYFPDPDLTPIVIPDEMIEEITLTMPELPEPKKRRYVTEYGLPEYDASILTGSKYLVQLFEQTVTLCGNPKEVSNWIMGDVMMLLKNSGKDAEELDISPASFASLITMVQKGSINRSVGKKVLAAVFSDKVDPEQYVKENGLETVNDDDAIRKAVEKVLAANEKSVSEYKSGKEKALQFLMGQSMRALRGKANPQTITAILHELLD